MIEWKLVFFILHRDRKKASCLLGKGAFNPMLFIFLGTLVYFFAGVGALLVTSNEWRAKIVIIAQILGSLCIVIPIAPILWGSPILQTSLQWSFPIEEINLVVDGLGAFFLLFSLPLTAIGSIYAYGYMKPYFAKKRHLGVHFFLLNLISLSFIMIYTMQNALAFFFGWELAAVSAWLLVIWEHENQKIRFAGFNYLVSTHIGLIFLIAGFMVIYSQTGSFDFKDFSSFLQTPSLTRDVAFTLLIISFGLKSAFFPFHTWLPRAHSAAPAHISALMSGVIHKAGLYGLLRITIFLGIPNEVMGWSLIGFSLISAFLGVLYTITQRDIKRLLGYSSTENVGIVGIGFGIGYLGLAWNKPEIAVLGFSGGLLHIFNHALFKCLLFYVAGSVYRITHCIDIEKLGGLINKMPASAFAFLCGSIAIAGLPPLNGFVSEFLIYTGLFKGSEFSFILIFIAAAFAFISAISAFSMVRAFGASFLGQPKNSHLKVENDAPLSMQFAAFCHIIGIFIFGFIPVAGLKLIFEPVSNILASIAKKDSASYHMSSLDHFLSPIMMVNVFFLIILILAYLVFKAKFRKNLSNQTHVTWGCGYTATNYRMQYSATSFSNILSQILGKLLFFKSRNQPVQGFFPASSSIDTHCVDSVEIRIFKALGNGESTVVKIVRYLREEVHVSFGYALAFLLICIVLLALGTGV